MSDIKLFKIKNEVVTELAGHSVTIEKSLQNLIERHLEAFLGIRFLATEYGTGKTHKGRIDTLGIDENGCPVIIEYKRTLNENVINQGLFYLDWLLDHRAEFELLVLKKLGAKEAEEIEWSSPRLLCIAGDFTKYDEHAVQQINRNIELLRYRLYGDELILFELVNATTAQTLEPQEESGAVAVSAGGVAVKQSYRSVTEYLERASPQLKDRYESLKAYLLALGDDVQLKTLKFYFAFKRIQNFCCVEVHPQSEVLKLFVKVNPDSVELEEGFTRDVREVGHFGTGDLEIILHSAEEFEKAKPLILRSYEAS